MAELTYFYATMNCGKSTLALQIHHNAVTAGEHCLLFTKHDRGGGRITSRIGLAHDAVVVTETLDIAAHVLSVTAAGEPVDVVICDETQFFSPDQIEQLAWLVDERDTQNARTVGGAIQRQGQQVVVGNLPQASLETGEIPAVAYEVLCRRHHRLGTTRAEADRQPEDARGGARLPVAGTAPSG